MYGLALAGAMGSFNISFVQCLVFSSLIVAVDPVAVCFAVTLLQFIV
jgi:NhaP-type Na+/H+ or K+/H+ antiporter